VTENLRYGSVEGLDVTGTLDDRSRISVSPVAERHAPSVANALPPYAIRLGGSRAAVTLWAGRAELVRLRDEIDAALADDAES
jgi:hypothetical protein